MTDDTVKTGRRSELVRIAKFVAVGFMNTGVYYGVYYLLLQFGVYFAVATTAGTATGLVNSYFWNKYFVFKASRRISGGEIVKFVTVYGIQYLCNLAIIYICITYAGLSAELAGLVAAAICPAISYTGLRFWGFKRTAA